MLNGVGLETEADGLSKVEGAAVKRFTVSYDKLCKSCPTRLQPRVDTLAEMILGLPDEERTELMERVAQRLEGEGSDPDCRVRRIKSSTDVYDFQTGGTMTMARATRGIQRPSYIGDTVAESSAPPLEEEEEEEEIEVVDAKLLKKMRKVRSKFDLNKQKLAKARRLLGITNALLAKDGCRSEPTIYSVSNPMDNAWYDDIDRLKGMCRDDLKMERLKLAAQKAKYESKVAKGRLKMYLASAELMDHVK